MRASAADLSAAANLFARPQSDARSGGGRDQQVINLAAVREGDLVDVHVLRGAQEDGRGCDAGFRDGCQAELQHLGNVADGTAFDDHGRLLLGEQDHSAVTIRPAARSSLPFRVEIAFAVRLSDVEICSVHDSLSRGRRHLAMVASTRSFDCRHNDAKAVKVMRVQCPRAAKGTTLYSKRDQ